MEITTAVIAAAFVGLAGLFFGWLAGHARNNNYTQALMNYIEVLRDEIEALKTELKDSGEFFNHEISVLTKELNRRQCVIDAYKIGESSDDTVLNGDHFTHNRTKSIFYCSAVSMGDQGQIISVTLVDSPDKLSAAREVAAEQFIPDWNPCNPVCDDFGRSPLCSCEAAVKSIDRQAMKGITQ